MFTCFFFFFFSFLFFFLFLFFSFLFFFFVTWREFPSLGNLGRLLYKLRFWKVLDHSPFSAISIVHFRECSVVIVFSTNNKNILRVLILKGSESYECHLLSGWGVGKLRGGGWFFFSTCHIIFFFIPRRGGGGSALEAGFDLRWKLKKFSGKNPRAATLL